MKTKDKEPTRFALVEVAKLAGISPQNLRKTYIKKGRITVKRDHKDRPYIDLVECLRVFGDSFKLPAKQQPVKATSTTQERDGGISDNAYLTSLETQNAKLLARLEALQEQHQEDREQLWQAKERETWLRGQVDKLTDTLKLLEAPKTPPALLKTEEQPQSTAPSGLLSRLFRW